MAKVILTVAVRGVNVEEDCQTISLSLELKSLHTASLVTGLFNCMEINGTSSHHLSYGMLCGPKWLCLSSDVQVYCIYIH